MMLQQKGRYHHGIYQQESSLQMTWWTLPALVRPLDIHLWVQFLQFKRNVGQLEGCPGESKGNDQCNFGEELLK